MGTVVRVRYTSEHKPADMRAGGGGGNTTPVFHLFRAGTAFCAHRSKCIARACARMRMSAGALLASAGERTLMSSVNVSILVHIQLFAVYRTHRPAGLENVRVID